MIEEKIESIALSFAGEINEILSEYFVWVFIIVKNLKFFIWSEIRS